ncbi:SET domain-containing protein [Sphaerisporangium aureirubrum]|uniref:Uncharacterized protein n=1 Tax=Sphaerisporangium aureirubrum TaxID=1544736 RepID=A0ABW1NIX1_9ACTN
MAARGRKALKWAGGVLFAGAVIAMGVYFARVGLENADRTASVIGAFVGLTGLAVTVYAMLTGTTPGTRRPGGSGETRNTVEGGTVYGPLVQGRDFHGDITLGPSTPRQDPPPGGERPATGR